MDVILLERIENLGELGEIVKIKPGYGRNYLIPQGKVLPATETNKASMDELLGSLREKQAHQDEKERALYKKLHEQTLRLSVLTDDQGRLYGSIREHDLSEAFFDQLKLTVEKQKIRIPNSNIRDLGIHTFTVHFSSGLDASVKVKIESSNYPDIKISIDGDEVEQTENTEISETDNVTAEEVEEEYAVDKEQG